MIYKREIFRSKKRGLHMIDFTECARRKKIYGGANGTKICVVYNNENYMLKFPAKSTKNAELSYTNICISEKPGRCICEQRLRYRSAGSIRRNRIAA